MKKSTIIISSVYMAYSLLVFTAIAVTIGPAIHLGYSIWTYSGMAAWALQWPIWIGLLKKQPWAWWTLTILFILMIPRGIWGIWKIATAGSYAIQYLPVVPGWLMKPPATPGSHVLTYLPIALLEWTVSIVLPLWMLLKDKPCTWRRSEP